MQILKPSAVAWVLVLLTAQGYAQDDGPLRGITITAEPAADLESAPIERVRPALPTSVDGQGVLEEYRAIAMDAVFVRNVSLTGSTVLPLVDVAGVTDAYRGRELTLEEIEGLRRTLTLLYVQRGYVNSGVLLADPAVTADGTLHFLAIEGTLEDIELSGNRYLNDGYVRHRLRNGLGPVLNVNDLERSLRLMQGWPLVAQVQAEILPGASRGTSVLDLQVREVKPLVIALGANNHRSPSIGEYQGTVSLLHRSLTRRGDYLVANYGLTDGLDDLNLAYGLPLTSRDLTLELRYGRGQSDIVESPFQVLDITSETERFGVRLTRPLRRTLTQVLAVSLEFENQRSESTLLGVPFSFSPGEQDGRSEVSAVRLGVDWSRRWTRDALGVRLRVSRGVDWLDATDNRAVPGGLPDSDFTSLLLQADFAHQFAWRQAQLLARVTAQSSSDPLLAVEKLAIGGARTVRGYRENRLVRDEGMFGGIEARVPLFVDAAGSVRFGLHLAPFLDYGVGRDRLERLPSSRAEKLASAGIGLIWQGWGPLHVEAYYGHRLKSGNKQGSGLQDEGVHVLATLSRSF